MGMKRIRKVLVMALLMAYVGQVLAGVAVVCPNMASAAAAFDAADVTAMEHAGHQMTADSTTEPGDAGSGCCDGGFCDMSHCQSAPALPLNHAYSSRSVASYYTGFAATHSPLQPVDSLYRPPISR